MKILKLLVAALPGALIGIAGAAITPLSGGGGDPIGFACDDDKDACLASCHTVNGTSFLIKAINYKAYTGTGWVQLTCTQRNWSSPNCTPLAAEQADTPVPNKKGCPKS